MAKGALSAVRIKAGLVELEGELALPDSPMGMVVFAHGSGSSRHSPRNRYVAHALQEGGLGTLLIDLLTPAEEQIDSRTAELRFNVELLAARVIAAVDWAESHPALQGLNVGLFGASTGAAAALVAAAARPAQVSAVVSRGGRPDLAGTALAQVRAATLLIVGGSDPTVLELNREALRQLRGEKEMKVVPGATHLFEEPGALEEVSRLAQEWFQRHLGRQNTNAA